VNQRHMMDVVCLFVSVLHTLFHDSGVEFGVCRTSIEKLICAVYSINGKLVINTLSFAEKWHFFIYKFFRILIE